jgi:cation:H+ antiporter
MALAYVAVVVSLLMLVWSADRFVEGSAASARHFGMPPLLIGMVIVGFGTSAPEMIVSALAALQGNPSLAFGNAYESNIALILGLTALMSPIAVHSGVLRKELPICLSLPDLLHFNSWTANFRESMPGVCWRFSGGLSPGLSFKDLGNVLMP